MAAAAGRGLGLAGKLHLLENNSWFSTVTGGAPLEEGFFSRRPLERELFALTSLAIIKKPTRNYSRRPPRS